MLLSLAGHGNKIDNDNNLLTCWTSVKILVNNFIDNISHNIIECGSILIQDNNVMFIPDFADSRVYSINNENLKLKNGQLICIEWKRLKYKVEFIGLIE